jgi:predicted nucleic acid-binding protein
MGLAERLQGVQRLFLDSAPIIYYVERHPRYQPLLDVIFDRIDAGSLAAITSPVTLAECLVLPNRLHQSDLAEGFADLIVRGANTYLTGIGAETAMHAAALRARCGLSLLDAFQVAVALAEGCEALLTNDGDLRRVLELDVIVLDDLLVTI